VLVSVLFLTGACGSSVDFKGGDGDAGHDVLADHQVDAVPDAEPDPGVDPEEDVETDSPGPDCGNGEMDAGEECDDGNDVDGDGCDNDCTWSCERNWECADDDFCTSDVCDVGSHSCTHAAIDCSDTDDCTVDGCDPASGCTHERLPNWYRDGDDDGYGVFSDRQCAATAPEGYVADSGDCCDSDEDAYPGQTAWFTETTACGTGYSGFDYDCSGYSERRWTTMGSCAHSGGGCVVTEGWTGSYAPYCGYGGTWISSCVMDGMTGVCVVDTSYERQQECH
jgi:cysteine-rich repeat protein